MSKELVECQAREAMLETHLGNLVNWVYRNAIWGCTPVELIYAQAALKSEKDDKALKEALATEREGISWIVRNYSDYNGKCSAAVLLRELKIRNCDRELLNDGEM